jgi:hypothetical protein
MSRHFAALYANREARWVWVKNLESSAMYADKPDSLESVIRELQKGDFAATKSTWDDLVIGTQTYHVESNHRSEPK